MTTRRRFLSAAVGTAATALTLLFAQAQTAPAAAAAGD